MKTLSNKLRTSILQFLTVSKYKMKEQGESLDILLLNNEYGVTVCYGNIGFLKRIFKENNSTPPKKLKDVLNTNRAVTYSTSESYPIIILPKKPTTPEEIGILAHEAVHAVDAVYKQIKEKKKRDEVFAHSVAAIVRETLLNLK